MGLLILIELRFIALERMMDDEVCSESSKDTSSSAASLAGKFASDLRSTWLESKKIMSFCFNQIPFYLNESEFGEANNDGESPIDG